MFSVIIPSYNGKDLLKNCLQSIKKARNRSLIDEIIVVDNGSRDGSIEYLVSEKIKIIKNKRNLGFAKAVNQGIIAAKSDYLVVVNNDLIVDRNWFLEIAKAIKKPRKEKIAAYSGRVLTQDGQRIESVGLDYQIKGRSGNLANGEANDPKKYNQEKIVFGASASIVAYYKPALLEVGLFDEDLFAYLEDVDLSLRLNNSGWRTIYLPRAVSYHLGGGTADRIKGFRSRMTARNWWLIIAKNYPLRTVLFHLPEIVWERLKNLASFRNLRDFFWLAKELMIKLPRVLKKRKPVKIKNYCYEN